MICRANGPPESESLILKVDRSPSVASQITRTMPASGTIAHQRLWTADRVTTPIRIMPTTASRRPSTSIAENPSASSTGGPTAAGRPGGGEVRAARQNRNRPVASARRPAAWITLCSFVFRNRTTTAVVVPVASIMLPRTRGCRRQSILEGRQGLRGRSRGGADCPCDGHRVSGTSGQRS